MVKVYAVSLAIGVVGLLVIILGEALIDRDGKAAGAEERSGAGANMAVAALVAFGMGGLSAEFAPIDLGWPVSFGLAIAAGIGGSMWARYAKRSVQRS